MSGWRLAVAISIAAVGCYSAWAQSGSGPEVRMILTIADHVNHKPPALTPDDVTIEGATITSLTPIDGGNDLELFVLIDDAANYDFGSKLQELRQFVISQPAPMAIGVAYVHDGELRIVQFPTADHVLAASALRAPSGSEFANPFGALSDLIQHWPGKALRHEIILVSSGIDKSACAGAEAATRDAQRAGAVVFALHHPGAHYLSEHPSRIDEGMIDLAVVGNETGGEAYFMSQNPAGSIEPFLSDIAEHLAHQYIVKFRLPAAQESGFQTIRVSSVRAGLELLKPEKVWAP